MAEYLIKEEALVAIAEAIRAKTGKTDELTLDRMPVEIDGIKGTGINFVSDGRSLLNEISESKCYFNGVMLPGISTDMLERYPYVWIRKDTTNGKYNLAFSRQPWYFSDSAMQFAEIVTVYYSAPISTDATVWTFEKPVNTSFKINESRTVLWSSHDIPNGSADATEIYFDGSEPIPV
jgi:hypothetical protein